MKTQVALCQEIRTGNFTLWKFKLLVKIVKICKKLKFEKMIKPCIKVLKKAIKAHLKQFFYQSAQDTAPSTKSAAIQPNKEELQSHFCYPKFNFPHSFSKYSFFFRQYHTFSI